MSLKPVRWCLAYWGGNLSPPISQWWAAALINPHVRHVSPFVHSCVQQHLKPCHQGDAVWVHWQMCSSFSGTEKKASSGPWHGAHASTTSQKTAPFDLSPASDFRTERWVRRNAVAPFAAREIQQRMWFDVDTHLNFFFFKEKYCSQVVNIWLNCFLSATINTSWT